MSKFLLLTDDSESKDGQQVIVGTSNIGRIYTSDGKTRIELIYPRGSDRYPRTIHVKESFEWVKNLLGLNG